MINISRESEINLINILIDQDIISGKDLINIKKVSTEGQKSQLDAVFELNLTDENKILDLWPTSILKKTFDAHNDCKKDLISFINDDKKDFPNGRSGNENKDLYESNYDIFSFAGNYSSLLKLIEFTGEGFKQIASHAYKEAWINQNINPTEITLKIKSMWFIDYLKDGLMFSLITSLVKESMKDKNIKLFVYYGFNQYPAWKKRMLFEPMHINVVLT